MFLTPPLSGVDLKARDNQGNVALFYAAENGHTSVALRLLEAGGGADSRNNNGDTPFHAGVYSGNLGYEIVNMNDVSD